MAVPCACAARGKGREGGRRDSLEEELIELVRFAFVFSAFAARSGAVVVVGGLVGVAVAEVVVVVAEVVVVVGGTVVESENAIR